MKAPFAALALLVSLLRPCTGLALDDAQLFDLMRNAIGDDEQTCAVIKMLNREISARPDDERLRNMRIAAYGRLADPYSARADVDLLAALHPDSPEFQLQQCLYAEATGSPREENRRCYLRVAELCRQLGKADAHSHEYLLALLLAEAPEAEETMRQFLATLSDSPMDQALKENLEGFSREQFIRRVDPSEIRHRCPREQ